MKQDIVNSFAEEFKHAPAAYSHSPGRLEILGNHTDYNEGYVLSCATGQATEMAISAIPGRICKLMNPPLQGVFTIDLDDMDKPRPKDWTKPSVFSTEARLGLR